MIEFKQLDLAYDNQQIFKNFNLSIKSGEKVVVSGKSGTGKSTLVKLVLMAAVPDKGSIRVKGRPVSEENIRLIRSFCAYVPQESDVAEGIVKDVIESIFSIKANLHKKPSYAEIIKFFKHFYLSEDIYKRNFQDLSGGEKQRIVIIIAILLKREIYLLDEATAALDAQMKQRVVDYFMNDDSLTLISVSHDDLWLREPGVRIIDMDNIQ